jgi:hypothetical protein
MLALHGNLQTNNHHHCWLDWLTVMVKILPVTLRSILNSLKQVTSTIKARFNSGKTNYLVDKHTEPIPEVNSTRQEVHLSLKAEDIMIKAGIHNSNIHFHRCPFD